MKNTILFVFLIISFISISSCKTSENNTAESTVKSIKKVKWVLRSMNDTKIFTPESGKDIYMILEEGSNNANGSGGCNNFSTSYTLSGSELKFGLIASTEMFCQNSMDTERDFYEVLDKTRKYKIRGYFLYLYDANGEIAKLEAQDLNIPK